MQSPDPRRRSSRPLCASDPKLSRQAAANGFRYPLGCVPAENLEPREGYLVEFESSQEEWPDCYMFDAVVSAEKVEPLVRDLLRLAPVRVTPILDVRGDDAYREIDPYLGVEEIHKQAVVDMLASARAFLLEDGHCGFGVVAEEPLFYLYVDDHKMVTVRVGLTDAAEVEEIFAAHDVPGDVEPIGVDAAAHDHLDTLWTDDNRRDLLDFYGMLDTLRYEWNLELNVDPATNVDDDGRRLGTSAWRVLLLLEPTQSPSGWRGGAAPRGEAGGKYAEILLAADCLQAVDELIQQVGAQLPGYRLADLVTADRIRPDELAQMLEQEVELDEAKVFSIELVD
jgi:hypothetical protein